MTNENGNGNGRASWWKRWLGRSGEAAQEASAYRRLALQLHYDLPREGGERSVLLLTPSTCRLSASGALGLAFSLERELGKSVLLVDACPARPEISTILGCADLPGWSDLLQDPAQRLNRLVLPTSAEHLRFLPAGRPGPAVPPDVQPHLKAAGEQHDFVLIFGGSVLNDASVLGLLPYVGCVLLLVTENETRIEDLKEAQEALALCKARNVRIVLTRPHRGKANFLEAPATDRQTSPHSIPKLVPE
jgi:hypothetical protein